MEGSRDEAMRQTLIADIECMEWDMFSSVNNIGGKADCQNDPRRCLKAIRMTWSERRPRA